MRIKRIELLNALESVKSGLASKAVIEQSDCFVFINNQVATYNDSIAVSFPIEIDIEGAVRSSELLSLLHKVKDAELDIYEKDNQFCIDGKKFKSGISMEKEINLPIDFLNKKMDFKKLPEGFAEAIKMCSFSAAKENEYPHLSNIHIKGDMVESCDNFRATRCTIEKMKEEMLLPVSGVRGILNFHFDHYCKADGWTHLTKETGAIFSCRTYEDKYPNLDEFFEAKGKPVRLPKEINEVLERGEVFSTDDAMKDVVTISITPKEIIIRGENDYGWFEESADVRRQGTETLKFIASARILKDILKHTSKAMVTERSMKFKAKNFDHVVSLIPK